MPPDTRSDAEVRAEDQSRAGNDAVEHRAIGGATVIRRNDPTAQVERAETRGHYRDLDGRRRVVGAGQPVPDGWTRIDTAELADRVGQGPDGSPASGATLAAEAESGDEKSPSSRRRRR
jgi:hypothetical protein